VRRLLAVPMCMLTIALLLTTGCGSDFWYEDDWLYDDVTYTSPWKNLDIYLNVADQDGDPVRGATVWVDGTLQEDKTGADYDALANSFPPGWRGWLYNWSGGPFQFDLRNVSSSIQVEILVSKTGYRSQRTTIRIHRDDPDDISMRQTFVMERSVNPSEAPTDAIHPAEKIASAQIAN